MNKLTPLAKLAVFTAVLGVAYFAYQAGRTTRTQQTLIPTASFPTPKPNTSPVAEPSKIVEQLLPNTTTIPTQAPSKQYKTMVSGLSASSKLNFTQYKITVLDGWETIDSTDVEIPASAFMISKGDYELKIYQIATGGDVCNFSTFVDITTSEGIQFRRGGTTVGTGFTMCSKTTNGKYGEPTSFGHISYKAPVKPDLTTLAEMDLMVASLKKM